MSLVQRAKNIILQPKIEWLTIDKEKSSLSSLLTGYLIPLALIPAIASLIGYGIIGHGPLTTFSFGITRAVTSLLVTIGGVFLSAFIIDILASSFGAEKNFERAFALVIYAYTPQMVAGVFLILPALGFITFFAGLYGLYILYLGLKPMMKTPDEKVTVYFIISLLVMIVVNIVLSTIVAAVFVGSMIGAASGF